MQLDEKSNIVRAAGTVGFFTLGSRILGFIRDMVMAFFFGASNVTDAFFVAFTIPNLLRRLFAEGTMTVSFVPVFTDYLTNRGEEEAHRVAAITMTALMLALFVVVFLGIVFAPQINFIVAPGFKQDVDKWDLTVLLTRIMFPYIFFISLAALAMGVLNSLRHFFAPAAAPMLLNIAMISAMYLISPFLSKPIVGLAYGVIIGGLLQLLFQIPFLVRRGMIPRLDFNFSHPAVKTIVRLMVPAVFGASIYQINIVVIRLLASYLPEGSISYLYYADRLEQLPVGIFAVALGTAILPSMSKMAAQNRHDELKETLVHSLSLTLYITLPATAGLIVLREPIFSLLFYRGEFDYQSVILSASALLFFSIGLPAVSAVRVIANAFYAQKDTRTPVEIGVVSIIVNILLSIILIIPMRQNGLALAVSLAACVNFFFLMFTFRVRMGRLGLKALLISTAKISLGCLLLGASAWAIASRFPWEVAGRNGEKALFLTLAIVTGISVYVVSTRLMRSRELRDIINPFSEKLKKLRRRK